MIDPTRIWSLSQLPTLPAVVVRLLEMSRDAETEIRDVIELIKSDPALSAKIVKAANSTYFGIKSEVKAIDRAVPLLGTTVTTSLALSFSLNESAMSRGPLASHYQDYWRQSIVQASAAEMLGLRIAPVLAPEFFLCGLLQDLGRLAMLKTIPQEYLPVLEKAKADGTPLHEVEKRALGFDHIEIGANLMEHWKLPDALIDAVRLHHASLDALLAERGSPQFPLSAATAVSACVGDYFCTPAKGLALERLRALAAQCFQFSSEQVEEFLVKCDERIEHAADLFQVDVTDLGDPADLMVQANEQLAQLAMREHVASTQANLRQQEAEKERKELESRNRELQRQALHDPLTQVYNRQFFDETLEREASRCRRSAAALGVLFIDIDHFKSVNDTYGHQFGDQVLKQVSQAIQSAIRASDVLARYGGEEFVVLASQPTEKGIEKLAERIRERVAQETFHSADQLVKVTCSIGGAIAIPARNDDQIGQELVAAADECLYEAKRAGRNRVCSRSLVRDADRQLMQLMTIHRFSRWLVSQQLLDVPTVSRALIESTTPHARIGELAVEQGYLTAEQVTQILHEQERTGERFGAIAVRLGHLTQDQLVHVLTLQQENPKQLAGLLIQRGLMPPDKALAALEQYLRTEAPPRPARVPAGCG